MIRDNANLILYENNREAREIRTTTQPELDALEAEALRIFSNTRASLADIEGISQWENALGIFPDPNHDTFDERRDRVLEVLRTSPPFTEAWMYMQLENRFPYGEVSLFLVGLTLQLHMDLNDISLGAMPGIRRYMQELVAWFRTWIPSNVLLMPLPTMRRVIPTRNLYIGGRFWRVVTRSFFVGMSATDGFTAGEFDFREFTAEKFDMFRFTAADFDGRERSATR
ncbi:MAG: YmfQ family protein [Defluviitaleaceae bacterium]|nr:YmfQ family protein [Defluviitaleaceae bacterium]